MKLKIFTAFSVVVFLVGLVSFNVSGQKAVAPSTTKDIARLQREAMAPRAFTATQVESYTNPDGKETVRRIRVRDSKSDGTWSEVWQSVGREGQSVHTGNPNTGEYVLSTGKESMTLPNTNAAGSTDQLYRNKEYLAGRQGFRGTEKIAGLEAYVFRADVKEKAGFWIETAHAPETGPFYLRVIYHNPDGSEVRIDTASVRFK